MRHLIYLHGFASSARSTKATAFAARSAEAGWSFACPDLNLPDFESLTISRMIDQVTDAVAASPAPRVALVGSSLGALVALEAAARAQPTAGPQIDALVFLAPALDLAPGLERHLGAAAMEQWQRTGTLDVFHYADQRMHPLNWAFMEDARRYDSIRTITTLPVLVYHGRRDDVVDVASVAEWAALQPRAILHLLDDDHQLLTSLNLMWTGTHTFLTEVA
jgi:pimeloyl-ACP methyl ester carboxylesterase